jgi:hypothetical protein
LGRRNEYFWGAFKFLFSFLEKFNIKHLHKFYFNICKIQNFWNSYGLE